MRTITLEFLRHGPAHNQLLSPLTEYLALCGNHGAESLNVPFEHNQLLNRLRALCYKTDDETREFQLVDTARTLGEILGSVVGLTADLSRHRETADAVLHLRLVISASELALLPFELSTAPIGFPGAGDWLLLQNQLPVCLTREVRRDSDVRIDWQKKPKILFIVAQPPDVGVVPLEPHLLALRRELEPWINAYGDDEERKKQIEKMLTILPEATVDQIQDACSKETYTHIHILAHGIPYTDAGDHHFGIALHPRRAGEPCDIVSGSRLATLLRAVQGACGNCLSSPCVVTLACCDSGNVGSVAGAGSIAGAGSSVAHALHAAGIPIVVASQFPLTFEGSILMVEILYKGLLRGLDPRACLNNLRRQLRARLPYAHDWAGLVAYAALPIDYDRQIIKFQISQAKAAIDSVLQDADRMLSKRSHLWTECVEKRHKKKPDEPETNPPGDETFEHYRQKIGEAKKMLQRIREANPKSEEEDTICGLLASAEKREAHTYAASTDPKLEEDSNKALQQSHQYYVRFAQASPRESWAIHQVLSLSLALGREQDRHGELWLQAIGPAQATLERAGSPQESVWARTDLIELFLLACDTSKWTGGKLVDACIENLPPVNSGSKPNRALDHVRFHVGELIQQRSIVPFAVDATARQMLRYAEWLAGLKGSLLGTIGGPAKELFKEIALQVEELFKQV
jgi:hypothetical protein